MNLKHFFKRFSFSGIQTPFRVTLSYAIISVLWILGSSHFLLSQIDDLKLINQLEKLKGLGFVVVTSGLLFALLQNWYQRMKKSHDQLKATLDTIPDLLFEVDLEGRYFDYHSSRDDLLAAPSDQLIGKTIHEVLPSEAAAICMEALYEANITGVSHGKQIELLIGEETKWFELSVSRKMDLLSKKPHFIVLSRDITERKRDEHNILRISQLYATLSSSNQAIFRSQSEAELFPKICHNAVINGKIKMAWIGTINSDTQTITPLVWDGEGSKYLENFSISLEPENPSSKGPTAHAVLTNSPQWIQDFQHDPATVLWHSKGIQYNWKSSAALPLSIDGNVIAVLNLYTDQTHFFDPMIQHLLLDMAADISFALKAYRQKEATDEMQEKLAESYQLLRLIIDISPVRIFWKDKAFRYLGCNQIFAHDAGFEDPNELIGKTDDDLVWKEQAHLYRQDDASVMEQGRSKLFFEEPQTTPDGNVVWLSTSKVPLRNTNGDVIGVLGIYEDITKRKLTEEQLLKLSQAIEQNSSALMITDVEGTIEYVNAAFTRTTGYTSQEVIGQNPRFLGSSKTPAYLYSALWNHLIQGEQWSGEFINRHKNGEEYFQSIVATPIVDKNGKTTHYMAVGEDITNRKKSEERIHFLANFDPLTGLPNHTQMEDHFNYISRIARRSGHSFALMFLDIDHFKDINDSLGHKVGDELLINLAQRLKSILREEDTISRQGGDEFVLILPDVDAHAASIIAQKLIESVHKPIQLRNYELSITFSIGVSLYPSDGNSLETLLKNADTAMFRAKVEGRNGYRFFTEEMQQRSIRTLELSNALHHAMQNNELQLVYQPQISANSSTIIGAEALLRWNNPVIGNVSPSEFIAIAEDNGLIIQIGEWVLRTAVAQAKEWMDKGLPPIIMAVNLSAIQFRHSTLPELITSILEEIQLPPEYLEIELTERAAMNDPEKAIIIMNKLHDQGIRMSIDDFGTGYSSLSYLKKFNIYKLKIDQSFVRDINTDAEDKAIVGAIINMAKGLGILTIAEGVETVSQLNFLKDQGCDEIQGYLFSKPLIPSDFEAFVAARSNGSTLLS